ncbi:MAG: purine-nucleoside phosphorylase [Pseudomonadota bacterium]
MAATAAEVIASLAPGFAPRVGIVLGSGLSALAERIEAPIAIAYGDLPGFPTARVEGHPGQAVLGRLGGVCVACLKGRAHAYEGVAPESVKTFIRTLKLIGCEIVILTNAAGALKRDLRPGELMTIADHINFFPGNPLAGPNDEAFGPRFPSLVDAYDPALRRLLKAKAAALGIALGEGVYLGCLGPSFETPAEIRAFIALGADAVGMSTVPEVIVARHCGLRVAAISTITNLAAGLDASPIAHAETLRVAAQAAGDLGRLLTAFLEGLGDAE